MTEYRIEDGVVHYNSTQRCYIVTRSERPKAAQRDLGVNGEEYYFSTFAPSRRRSFRRGIAEIRRRRRGQATRLLDVGTGFGLFLEMAKEQAWDVVGIEPSTAVALRAQARTGVRVLAMNVESLATEERWDVVSLWDVVEHCSDAGRALRIVRGVVRENGTLLVRVPNCQGIVHRVAFLLSRVTRGRVSFPLSKLCENHHYLFEREGVRRLLDECGFRVIGHYQERLMSPWVCGRKRYLVERSVVVRSVAALLFAAVLGVGWLLGAEDSMVFIAEPR